MKKIFYIITILGGSNLSYSQYVGIGTLTPSNLLHVRSSLPDVDIAKFESNGGFGQILVSNGIINTALGSDVTKGYAGTNTDHDFMLRAGGDDLIVLRHSNGFMGLGTSTPEAKLNVVTNGPYDEIAVFKNTTGSGNIFVTNGSQSAAFGISPTKTFAGSATYTDFALTTGGVNRLFIKHSNGSIGIGTNNPTNPLHVVSSNPNVELSRFQSNGGFGNILVGNGSAFSDLGHNGTKGWTGTSSPQDFAIRTGSNDRIFIQNTTGNVGIGTTAPQQKLDISGNARISGNQTIVGNLGINSNNSISRFQLFEGGTNSILALFEGEGGLRSIDVTNGVHQLSMGADLIYGYVQTSTPSDFAIRTGGGEKVMIKHATGNVGIGTNNPQEKLEITGNAKLSGNLGINSSNAIARFQMFESTSNSILALFAATGGSRSIKVSNGTHQAAMGSDSIQGFIQTSSASDFAIRTGGTTRMFFQHSTGNVGIGTASPSMPLSLKANGSNNLMQYNSSANVPLWHWWMPGNDLVLTESGVQDFRLTIKKTTGNIGIGTANPVAKLEVNGNSIFAGTMQVNADMTIIGSLDVINIDQPGLSGVTFNANFSNYGGVYENVTYYMDKEGRVHLSGLVSITGTQSGTIFTLPAGNRPQGQITFLVMGGTGPSRVDVHASGSVSIATPVTGWISMNGISFRASQ